MTKKPMISYDEIKKNLSAAGRLLDEGKIVEGAALIHSMIGRGLTLNDMDVNLSKAQFETFRLSL